MFGVGSLLGLAVVFVVFTLVRLSEASGSGLAQRVALGLTVALGLSLAAGGLGIVRYDLTSYAPRIAGWTYLGAAALLVAVSLNTVLFEVIRPGYTIALYLVTNAAAGGAVLGFVIGLYDGHQRQSHTELAAKQREATALSTRLSVLNRVLRHDIRTRAQVLRGHSERLASGDLAPTNAAVNIDQTTDRLLNLSEEARELEQLLEHDAFETEAVDIVTVVEGAVRTVETTHSRLTLTLDLPDERRVQAPPLFRQAIEHVLENAAEHNDSPDPRAEVTVEAPEAGMVALSIADNGPGIDQNELIHNTGAAETGLEHSTGLGLWLATWIVEEGGGTLAVETPSSGEFGTVVTLRVPTV
ncbi:HAMP domain-containing histidine kinase [Halosimplex litoreum]|uniref:histidine kinase n=1 Tax=Halosimplex litoreum TaxID=1198301 RepID=A0A7T3FVW5_9EURY|nr:HAMP domain-containing sensor histidine kinase [Halosimplex litoreum]QPV61616.1 HAMP domain-containing histidine kinase [Halosimplex litoreum]